MPPKKLLILGGTGEAAELANKLVQDFGKRLNVTVSYSGITGSQPDLPCSIRVGGFGGASGLRRYIKEEGVDCLIDATHPFAQNISRNASDVEIPSLRLMRPIWERMPEDNWINVPSMEAAAHYVKNFVDPVFLSIGIKELHAFKNLEETPFIVRLLKEPEFELPLCNYEIVTGRPPFSVKAECLLFSDKKIKVLVTKNSGGGKTKAKIIAARKNAIQVVMVERPTLAPMDQVMEIQDVIDWLAQYIS